jgi:hypothetical protein
MKLRLVRLNPLLLSPGELTLMAARQMDGLKIVQFPVRLEYWETQGEAGRMLLPNECSWQPVEFVNEFQLNEDNDVREVRPEVQVPVYTESSGNKRRRSDKGGGQP